jgi:hypothetical protein
VSESFPLAEPAAKASRGGGGDGRGGPYDLVYHNDTLVTSTSSYLFSTPCACAVVRVRWCVCVFLGSCAPGVQASDVVGLLYGRGRGLWPVGITEVLSILIRKRFTSLSPLL